jgi:Holliday junction resolvasome RuvABC endonuclease subunit
VTVNVLALDPGSQTGFAYGYPGCNAPRSGNIRLDSKSANGRRFCVLEGRIRHLIAAYEIDEIYVEAPFIQTDPSKFDIKVVRLGYGYQAAILMAGEKEGIGPEKIFLVEPGVWRKSVLGRAMAPKGTENSREWLKLEAVKACDKRGWPIRSQDEAEACLLWEYGSELSRPGSTIQRLPLFEQLSL